jgi:hypothetical protein
MENPTGPGLTLIIALALVALTILGFAVHVLFSPWLLLVAVGIVAWIKFRPRRSHQ